MTVRRLPVVLVLLAALVGLVVVARDDRPATDRPFGRSGTDVAALADPDGSLSSTWYCAGGTAEDGGHANLTVVIANTSGSARAGSVTWVTTPGEPETVPFTLAPRDSTSLDARRSVSGPVVSAVVESAGGGIVVEHLIAGPRGRSAAPCASDPSTSWYLAGGTTQRDAAQVLAVFNPFPDDAVVDVTFETENGRRRPAALRGMPIAARSTAHIDVGGIIGRHATTATTVTARAGRIVVDRVQRFDGSAGRTGLALTLAAPARSTSWWFPDGVHGDTTTERWHLYNPGRTEALVSVEVVPAEGEAPEPRDITVPPHGIATVVAGDPEGGLAAGVAHATTIRSLGDVPIVAERELDVRGTARRGWASVPGSPLAARRWAFAIGEASDAVDEWIVVQNAGPRAVTVSVVALAGFRRLAIDGLGALEIPPAGRLAIRLGDHLQRGPLPIVVEASAPVVVERDLYLVGQTGVTTTMGVPLR